ncbi:MAG: ABC transporter permease [Coriobacteriia bacterium]|nr:ABC transporter permease [Coriobacteriia bacterium]
MNWTLLRGTLHQRRSSIFWFTVSLALYAWMTLWFWGEMGDALQKMMDSYPAEILAIFGGNEVSFATAGGFLQIEFLGLMWIIIIASAAILFAGRMFSGEIGAGTMEFLLAQPLSRTAIAVTRVIAFAGYALLLSVCTFVPIQVLGPTYGVELGAEAFWSLFGLGTLFILGIGGLAMLLSSMFRDSGKPAAITSGVLLLFWIADMVANVSEAAEFFDPVNLVSYWQPGLIINGESAASESWWVYGILALVTLAGSVLVFSRRDVA